MKDFSGINGCYDIETFEENEVVSIYLNSPIVYEDDGTEEYNVRSLPDIRTSPDIDCIFELPNEDGISYITELTVYSIGADGVQDFVAALMQENIITKDSLIVAVKTLLEQPGVVWGKITLDDEVND